jgi:hypothetical protein
MSAPLVLPGPLALAALIAGRSPTEITIADDDPLSGIVKIVANANGSGRRDIFVQVCAQRADGAQLVDQVLRIDPDAPPPTTRFTLLTGEDIEAMPDPEWLAEGWIMENATSVLFGNSGTYKTFAALDLALSVGNGVEWLGMVPVPRARHVVYVLAEGIAGIKQRQRAWLACHPDATTDNIRYINAALNLLKHEEIDDFVLDVRRAFAAPDLVIIDTLARSLAMGGGDENSARDMGIAYRSMDALRNEFHCHVLVVHHTGRNSDHERGSTLLGDNADTRMFMSRDYGAVRLECPKQKDVAEPPAIGLKLTSIDGTGSCVLNLFETDSNLDRTVLQIVSILGETFPLHEGASTAQWRDVCLTDRLTRPTFYRARTKLLTMEFVRSDGGRNGRNFITELGLKAIQRTADRSPDSDRSSHSSHGRLTSSRDDSQDLSLVRLTSHHPYRGETSETSETPGRGLPYKDDDDDC